MDELRKDWKKDAMVGGWRVAGAMAAGCGEMEAGGAVGGVLCRGEFASARDGSDGRVDVLEDP
jgi:hypothetical protein